MWKQPLIRFALGDVLTLDGCWAKVVGVHYGKNREILAYDLEGGAESKLTQDEVDARIGINLFLEHRAYE